MGSRTAPVLAGSAVGLLGGIVGACKTISDSRDPLDDRVDAFIEEHGIDPWNCGVVEYPENGGCSEESSAAIACFAEAQTACTEARVDTVNWFVNDGVPFYTTIIVWADHTGCVMELMTYSVERAREGEDDAFQDFFCTDASWRTFDETMCKKMMWEADGCHY